MIRQGFFSTPFAQFENLSNNKFLVVHHTLVEKSEMLDLSLLHRVDRTGDFFSFTYEQVSEATKVIASKMLSAGLTNQKLVPILMTNSFDLILSVISLWRTGAVPVPLNVHLLKNELENKINFLNAECTICENNFADYFPTIKKFVTSNTFSGNKLFPNDFKDSDTAVLLFTSGTSGKPKAVPLSYNNLSAAFKTGDSIFKFSKKDSWYLNLPLYHIGGFSILVRAILAGSKVILPESNEFTTLKRNLKILKPTLISLVPTQLKRICEDPTQPNKELRAALIGGGFAADAMLSTASNLGWKIYKVYGSTETSAFITILTPGDFVCKPKSIGKPLNQVEIQIFDARKNVLHQNEIGEIGVKAFSVFKEYFSNTADTSSAFYNGFYLTGDFGYYDTDGYLYLENRRTDLIVSGGENLSPIEIEKVLLQFQNVDEACVFGIPDNKWGEIVVAAVVTKDKRKIDLSALKIFLKRHLPAFKIPKKYFQVEELPKSAIGKIKRSEVKKQFIIFASSHTSQ